MRGFLRMVVLVLAFAWLSLAAKSAAAQKVYKWTDKDGKVHFSNVGPGAEGSTEEGSGVSGIEAQGAEPAPAEPTGDVAGAPEEPLAAAPQEPDASGDSSSTISEEAFSSQVSATRMRLKRELAAAKEQSQQADEQLAALKKELNEPTRIGLEILQKAYGPDQRIGSEEDALRKQKHDADARIEEIRKQYADLQAEAVKRFGHQPSWWLPLD
jgi:Domain of unknown function (DUF4124)